MNDPVTILICLICHYLLIFPQVVSVTPVPKDSTTFSILLSSTEIAPFVWLEAEDISGRFSENGFLMLQKKKIIKFHAWENVKADKLNSSLTVRSLMDVYN